MMTTRVLLLSGLPLLRAAAPANNGFGLAVAILAVMILALIYTIVMTVRAQGGAEVTAGPGWAQSLIPVIAVLGMGVAAYLTFVETRNVAAVCGPVGDCNSVQSSPYARLFGFFPVGLLGLLGYIAILIAWIVGRSAGSSRLGELTHIAMLGMAVFGVLFSIYLTYLELWVILAVCIWCLSSAVLITLLMLLSLRPALAALAVPYEEDGEALEA